MSAVGETVPGTVCRDGPKGASHKRFLAPFPLAAVLAFAAALWLLLGGGCGEDDRERPTPPPEGTVNGLPTEPVALSETIALGSVAEVATKEAMPSCTRR